MFACEFIIHRILHGPIDQARPESAEELLWFLSDEVELARSSRKTIFRSCKVLLFIFRLLLKCFCPQSLLHSEDGEENIILRFIHVFSPL